MNGGDVIQILVSAGGTGLLMAILNAVLNRRKLSAEATEIITKAATSTIDNVLKDNESLRTRTAALESKIARLEGIVELAEQRERMSVIIEERYRWHTQQWQTYCAVLAGKLKELGHEHTGPIPPAWPGPANLDEQFRPALERRRVAADPEIEHI